MDSVKMDWKTTPSHAYRATGKMQRRKKKKKYKNEKYKQSSCCQVCSWMVSLAGGLLVTTQAKQTGQISHFEQCGRTNTTFRCNLRLPFLQFLLTTPKRSELSGYVSHIPPCYSMLPGLHCFLSDLRNRLWKQDTVFLNQFYSKNFYSAGLENRA